MSTCMRSQSSADILSGRRTGWAWRRSARTRCTLSRSGVSWDGLNQAVCALRFFYGVTLGRSAMVERIPYARKPAAFASGVERGRGRAISGRRSEIRSTVWR